VLRTPPAARVAHALGIPARTVEELAQALGAGAPGAPKAGA